MSDKNEAKLELKPTELTKEEQKRIQRKLEKEEKKKREYMNSMVTRAEAYSASERIAEQKIRQFSEFTLEPLRANLIQTLALIDFLKDKGIIESDEEFQKYLDKVAERAMEQHQEGDTNGKEGEKGNNPEKEKEFKG